MYIGNPTNMWQHLKGSHPGHFKQAKLDESSPRSASASISNVPGTVEMTRETAETDASTQ